MGLFQKGHKHSPEILAKLSQSLKGRTVWNTGTKGIMKANSGSFKKGNSLFKRKHSEESKAKMRLALKGKVPWNKGTVGLVKAWNKGKNLSPEHREKVRQANLGKKHLPKTIEIMKAKALRGELSPVWISDRSKLKRDRYKSYDTTYIYWMRDVKKRDNWKCKMANNDCKGRLEAHHILTWREYPELRYDLNNGITLCHYHHPRKRNEEKRLVSFFQRLVII